ncbi:uncharacterized protein N7487_009226 [Penicillium crustosum]|uniref:uncharacterized protein n=1 Tax=Penicillium crustosum TaxID=36656 RepID=UPI002387F9C0|nr:uncharacterized protein N7487_009226 [Penicillium crustosum]KAJ5394923.1 hypothetical protein N7487_009226 [Penicillium crustosum]
MASNISKLVPVQYGPTSSDRIKYPIYPPPPPSILLTPDITIVNLNFHITCTISTLTPTTPHNRLPPQSLIPKGDVPRFGFDIIHTASEHNITFVIQRKESFLEPHPASDSLAESH